MINIEYNNNSSNNNNNNDTYNMIINNNTCSVPGAASPFLFRIRTDNTCADAMYACV